ncbi:hypothetical protein SNE40_012063 [Patella caerulea]|uniref:Iodothyronine deiodinase n=1 Tax=Patella caerulea TaxID=87958 RepID=A0AAN8JP15_PATCE
MEELNSAFQEFGASVDFLLVYIQEAHATDGWVIPGNDFSYEQHKDIKDRIQAAKDYKEHYNLQFPVVVDDMDNESTKAFDANPVRIIMVRNGTFRFASIFNPPKNDYIISDEIRKLVP